MPDNVRIDVSATTEAIMTLNMEERIRSAALVKEIAGYIFVHTSKTKARTSAGIKMFVLTNKII